MAVPSPLARRHTVAALLGLTAVTGLVDAVSYLRLGHVFVANMTGNLVFIAFGLHPHSGLSPVASVVGIGGFFLGALMGGRAATHLAHRHRRHWLAAALGAEAVILAVAAILMGSGVLPLDGSGRYATVAVLAVALGVQNSTVRHFGVPDLTTTVLTLTLTGLAADSRFAGGSGARPHRRIGSIAAMFAGAGVGALLLNHSVAVIVGIAAVLVAAIAGYFLTGPAAADEARSAQGPAPAVS